MVIECLSMRHEMLKTIETFKKNISLAIVFAFVGSFALTTLALATPGPWPQCGAACEDLGQVGLTTEVVPHIV